MDFLQIFVMTASKLKNGEIYSEYIPTTYIQQLFTILPHTHIHVCLYTCIYVYLYAHTYVFVYLKASCRYRDYSSPYILA